MAKKLAENNSYIAAKTFVMMFTGSSDESFEKNLVVAASSLVLEG